MSLNRYAKQRDANEGPIVDALEQVGARVYRLDTPFDLLVWYRGTWFALEVKLPFGPKGGDPSKLEPSQRELMLACPGGLHIVRDPRAALRAVGL